ncbi:hypothetical protein D3C78_1336850 [compost metagenome]
MLAGLCRSDNQSWMVRGGGGHDYGINVSIHQNVLQALEERNTSRCSFKAPAFRLLIPDGDNFRLGMLLSLLGIILGMDMPEA